MCRLAGGRFQWTESSWRGDWESLGASGLWQDKVTKQGGREGEKREPKTQHHALYLPQGICENGDTPGLPGEARIFPQVTCLLLCSPSLSGRTSGFVLVQLGFGGH